MISKIKRKSVNERYSLKISKKYKNSEMNIPFVNEKACSLLKEDEICLLGYDNDWIYIFDSERFFRNFSENFKMKPCKFKKSNYNGETIIFKDKYYAVILEKLDKIPLILIKNSSPKAYFLVHPISRKVSVKNDKKEKKIDIFPLLNKDIKCLGYEDLLDRLNKAILEEWNKLHKNKKIDYIS